MKPKFRAVRAFGWQFDYRPDGWLPLGVRQGNRQGWHILRLGPLGCITLGRLHKPRDIVVTLTADTTQFVGAMAQLHESTQVIAWRRRLEHERSLGMAYVGVELDRMCRGLGLDPFVVWRMPRAQERQDQRVQATLRVMHRAQIQTELYRSHPWDGSVV